MLKKRSIKRRKKGVMKKFLFLWSILNMGMWIFMAYIVANLLRL